MTSKLVVNTIEADTGISSVSFASSISMDSTSKFHFSAAGIDIGADTNINRPAAGVLGFNINSSEKARINASGYVGINENSPDVVLHIANKELAIGADPNGAAAPNATYDGLLVDGSLASIINIRTRQGGDGLSYGGVGFSDDVRRRGAVDYLHNDGSGNEYMRFNVAGAERLRITSEGQVKLTGSNSGNHMSTFGTNVGGLTIDDVGNQHTALQVSHGSNNVFLVASSNNSVYMSSYGTGNFILEHTGGGGTRERLRIDSSGNLLIGDSAGQIGKLSTLGTGNHISAIRHSTDASSANFLFAKYRGSRSSPTVVADGDMLGDLAWYGYNGSSIIKAASVSASASSTVDGSNMPTDLIFKTTSGNTNTERLRITSQGYVTKPSHPYFDVSRSAGAVSSTNVIVYNNVYVNNGNHYSTSNGRFTAPVDGHYQFWFGHIKQNTSGVVRAKWRKNGGSYLHGNRELRMDSGDQYGDNGAITIITNLSKNDYVQVVVTEGTVYATAPEYTYFCGTLLG